ncbi:MAG TPA: SAM-dependent methyltransferase, partial [Chloroflexia bacterium]|nr:SAM-dependent methyltransferase [Chloroflexia bacterium]
AAKREFRRILKPGGWVVLVWNDRLTTTSTFLAEYEQLLRTHATDYKIVNHREIDVDTIGAFYEPGELNIRTFDNRQLFDFEGLKGRFLSSSYSPEEGHPDHEIALSKLQELFDKHNTGGKVAFEYDTLVYYGKME